MKVVGVSLFVTRLPLVHGFETSSHRKSHLDHILVRLTDASGAVGWGEIASASDPFYSSETVDTALLVARKYIVPAIIGHEWETPADLATTWARIRGHEFAKAGFDMAAWSLYSGMRNEPLSVTLGGTRTEVAAGVSLGIEASIDALLAEVSRHVDAGYRRVKLKIKPGWDIEPVRAVRAAFPEQDVHVDANGIYRDTDETTALMRGLDEFSLSMIEQPYGPRDFVAHASLQAKLATPICLDEGVVDLDDIGTMIALGAGRILNIKVSRMGGLTVALAAHDLARDAGIPVWCGGMHEFGVGRAANVALSSLPNFSYPSDVSASEKYYARDIISPPVTATDGMVTVPTGPGLGHEVLAAWITENTITHEHYGEER
ncbi:o-succinylbenzoate synthase [Cryobacterium arcticum]|uniref:o-succinylbenzoate synthase n=1 Tax=Cryobacterium arcticum TaxID=670052 RepID=A0A318A3L1_9MICO|nr:o-succinylbenzoate synthase [Cryobacterium arcticum]PXA71770.1 o-succinylbenzoate synthase [Cryobacterium arcticum]